MGLQCGHYNKNTQNHNLDHITLKEFKYRKYKFKKIRGMTDFSDQFRKIIMSYKRIGYNLNVM